MKVSLIVLAIAALPLGVSAAPVANEIQVGAGGNGRFVSEKVGDKTVSTFQARGSYALGDLFQWEELQIGGEAQFISNSGGAKSTSAFELAGFATWNFDTDFSEAFYVKAGFGTFAYMNASAEYENKFGVFGAVGKRFPLMNDVIYNPEARIYKKDGIDPSFEVLALNISILF